MNSSISKAPIVVNCVLLYLAIFGVTIYPLTSTCLLMLWHVNIITTLIPLILRFPNYPAEYNANLIQIPHSALKLVSICLILCLISIIIHVKQNTALYYKSFERHTLWKASYQGQKVQNIDYYDLCSQIVNRKVKSEIDKNLVASYLPRWCITRLWGISANFHKHG